LRRDLPTDSEEVRGATEKGLEILARIIARKALSKWQVDTQEGHGEYVNLDSCESPKRMVNI
jgi:hypothetical protein